MPNIEINRKTLAKKWLRIMKSLVERGEIFFRYAKSKLNFKNAIPDLVDNDKILSDDNSKAKAFNMFFKNVF